MKSNPLTLSNKKLHAATNLVFEEGVIKTRPGIIYRFLKAVGQFQGACEYRPMQGISSGRFSEAIGGIAFVAGGDLWIGCKKVATGFKGIGEVNLFQAENFLILQSPESDTYWWDGEELIQSPGLNEVDWNETETPVHELEVIAPEADIPDCGDSGAESGVTVTFTVVNSSTEKPVKDAIVTVNYNGRKAYYGLTNEKGQFVIHPVPREYTYSVVRSGYHIKENVPFTVNAIGAEREFEACYPPQIIVTGDTDVNVRLDLLTTTCIDMVQTLVTDVESVPIPNQRRLTFTNNTTSDWQITQIEAEDVTYDVEFPIVVPPDEEVSIIATGPGTADLFGQTVTIITDCSDTHLVDVPFVSIDYSELPIILTFWVYGEDYSETTESVTLTGSVSSGIYIGTCSKGNLTFAWNTETEQWLIAFDTPVPTIGDAITAFHGTLNSLPSPAPESRGDPTGYYLDNDAAPFPNWGATVTYPPP